MSEPEIWSINEVVEFIGAASTASARHTLSRWGVRAKAYQLSPNGRPRAVYSADEVRAAKADRPGRGARTDLNTGPA